MTGIWTTEGLAKVADAIANNTPISITHFVLSGASTLAGVTDPFVEDPALTEATFPDEIYRDTITSSTKNPSDTLLTVVSEILASVSGEFYANGIGLIHDDGAAKTLLAVAAFPMQGRKLGIFTRYRFELALTGQGAGINITFPPNDYVSPTELNTAIAGHGHWNAVKNGCARVARRSEYSLVKDVYAMGKVDQFECMATGTTVDAGIITQKLDSTLSRTGFSLIFSGVTLTGAGELYLRCRIFSEDAKHFKNQKASLSFKTLHDVGSTINYIGTMRKANALDDFAATTQIATSGHVPVVSGVNTRLTFPGIDMGDCSNGIEIEIKIEPGAITAKNFELTEGQLEVGETVTDFDLRPIELERVLCHKHPYYNIIIDSNPYLGDYTSLAAYISDAPQVGDRVLVKVDETLTATLVIPERIEITFYKEKVLNVVSNFSPIVQFGNHVKINGLLKIVNNDTGVIAKAFSFNGDECSCENLMVDNQGTGTITNAFYIEPGKKANYASGVTYNAAGGTITTVLNDSSGVFSNDITIRERT